MNTIIYSAAGIIALVAIAFLFTYIETFRDIKWKDRLARIREFTGFRTRTGGIIRSEKITEKKKIPAYPLGIDMPVI